MIQIITSNIFKLRMSISLEKSLLDNGFNYEWHNSDILSKYEIRELVYKGKNIILENNCDTELYRYALYKNCICTEISPFKPYGYFFDNDGWKNRSRICKNTKWRNKLNKIGMRKLISYRENQGINRCGPVENGIDVYIPSKNLEDAYFSLNLFKKHRIRFDKVITDLSFPEETRKIAEEFSCEIGSEYICSKDNIQLNNCKKVVSDHLETTVLAIMQGIIPYSFAKSIISGSHATYEYMGDMNFYNNSVSISMDHADSVIYRLLTEIVPADSSCEYLKKNPVILEFLSSAKENENA